MPPVRLKSSPCVVLACVATAASAALDPSLASAQTPTLVISQVYGGGGNSGAMFRADFIELFNAGGTAIDLSGWSVQYAPASANGWQVTPLSGTLQPGHYFLIREALGAGGTIDLPTPDAIGTIAMGSTSGIVALVQGTTALAAGCASTASAADLIGYGTASCSEGTPTGALSNTTAASRALAACTDTNVNQADFSVVAPAPRNSQSAPTLCGAPGGDCSAADTPIGSIQGTGDSAALTGTQTIQGVVVADYEYPGTGMNTDYLRGFYVQNAPGTDDANPLTSDAIFVYNGNQNSVSVGQLVQVTGAISEFGFSSTGGTLTELTASSVVTCPGTATITPTDISFPLAAPSDLERWEGMLVRIPQTMTVTEHFQLGRFGQVLLSSGGRLRQPTSVADKGAPAAQVQADNARRQILLDDELQQQNPDPIRFGRGGAELTATNTLRGGDSLSGVVGVLTQTDATTAPNVPATTDPVRYRIRPYGVQNAQPPSFTATNPRPALPLQVEGDFKVASVNMLNYFNTFGNGACSNGVGGASTDCRGAGSAAEFDRQWPKTVNAILATGADVIALNELENDGYGTASALQDLVSKLNAATAANTFGFIDVDAKLGTTNALGTDAIRVALIYRTASARPVGSTAALNTGAFGQFTTGAGTTGRNRPALAQAFAATSGASVVVVVNHLKSKGSSCADNISPVGPDPDLGDGQGECNLTRTAAATQLVSWLNTNPTGTGTGNVLVLGDFNAYTHEDPIVAMRNGGFTNLVDDHIGADAYSYVFNGQWGYLDYAFASPGLASLVADVAELHNNADEPAALDYNTDFKTARLVSLLYAQDAYRASDHDPVVVGLNLTTPAAPVPAGSLGHLLLLGGGLVLTVRRRRPAAR